MSEQALYRKYRSHDFSEVIGQDHVVNTLLAALKNNRLRHAYLFTGPRGVGKTSVARLLARALNCTGQPKPCNACDTCRITLDSSLDVVEMDAASNRSIDSIRDLREKIKLAPSIGKYKVYIIDEVHMLTNEAFNALLKTLEEPPAHAVFILATTEAHKLPDTIVSRTQVFHFKPISKAHLTKHLKVIAQGENINASDEALNIIATVAEGGFRDAISLLDQLSASSQEQITHTHVRELLGYTEDEEIMQLSLAIAQKKTSDALKISLRLSDAGAQPGIIALQIAHLWRKVLLAAAGAEEPTEDTIKQLAQVTPPAQAAKIMATFLEVASSAWPQYTLEAALVALTSHPAEPVAKTAPVVKAASSSVKKSSASAPSLSPSSSSKSEAISADLWPKVLVQIKSQNNSLAALLQMYPVDFNESEIIIKPRFNFHRDLFVKPANRTTIEAAASKVYGQTIKISARTEEGAKASKRSKPDPTTELVSSALEILGGEVVD